MQENAAFEDSSGMSREKIEQERDALLQLRTLYIAVNSQQDSPEMGVSPFIRRDDGLYIFYQPSLAACSRFDGARRGDLYALC
ncbi:MAG: hypothetical protein ACJ0BH_07330 [Candidatus Puniceispirillaceae bacterium]